MEEKKKYSHPEIEIDIIEDSDILTSSNIDDPIKTEEDEAF